MGKLEREKKTWGYKKKVGCINVESNKAEKV